MNRIVLDTNVWISLDTNVWISALAFGGRVRMYLDEALKNGMTLVVSEEIISETLGVLGGTKIGFPPEALVAAEMEMREIAQVVRPTLRLDVVKRDPDDDRVLECAVESSADVIVSGDDHLLALGAFRGVRIMDPASFSARFPGPSEGPSAGGSSGVEEPPAAYRPRRVRRLRKTKNRR